MLQSSLAIPNILNSPTVVQAYACHNTLDDDAHTFPTVHNRDRMLCPVRSDCSRPKQFTKLSNWDPTLTSIHDSQYSESDNDVSLFDMNVPSTACDNDDDDELTVKAKPRPGQKPPGFTISPAPHSNTSFSTKSPPKTPVSKANNPRSTRVTR